MVRSVQPMKPSLEDLFMQDRRWHGSSDGGSEAMSTDTSHLLMDTYHELNAKKLFWITLVLSGLIVIVIGAIGLDRGGFSIFGWSPEILQSEEMQYLSDAELNEARSIMYKEVFNLVGITVWLTWAAIILAIFSTAGMFPDLMTTGAIDTLLTKPISRLRLFLTKYLLGLGFVGLQVSVFAISAFLVIGFRASDWDPTMFLAIPIVLLFFSYLYAICVLVGVWTRSTLLAVILTIVAWLGMFVINIADSEVLGMQAEALVDADIADKRADYINTLPNRPEPEVPDEAPGEVPNEAGDDGSGGFNSIDESGPSDLQTREGYAMRWGDEDSLREQSKLAHAEAAAIGRWRWYGYLAKTPLPKTGETRELMTRLLRDEDAFKDVTFDPAEQGDSLHDPFFGGRIQLIAKKKYELGGQQRPWAWILLTSLLFEVVVVGLAAWRFCRRDY